MMNHFEYLDFIEDLSCCSGVYCFFNEWLPWLF